ncbi:Fork-head domain-containing protein [Fusarium keratoplasticum]|nr:Fork-head domain-containing protein [Fusarium keratoplasticum]
MDPPFPHGGQASSYTNPLLAGHGQQSSCVSELTDMGSYYALSSGPEDQSPHLSEAGSLPTSSTLSQQPQQQQQHQQRSYATHIPTPFTSIQSGLHYPPRSHHQAWPSPPPGPDDLDNYSYHSSPTCGSAPTTCYNPSPVSPRTWSSPDYPLQQASETLHQNQQESFKNLQICTPTSTEGFPVRGPQVLTPFTASMSQGLEGEVDGLPRSQSPATIPTSSAGVLSGTNSPREGLLDAPTYMTTKEEESPAGEPENRASPEKQPETRESQGSSAVGAKPEEPYAQLIYRALMGAPGHAMTLQEIYQWFRDNTDKESKNENTGKKSGKNAEGWQNSIRHNLSMNKAFTKDPPKKEPGSGPSMTESTAGGDPKRSTEWRLVDWAIRDGVQSTTRYRPGNSARRAMGSKVQHHPYNHHGHGHSHGFQQHGKPISTKAMSGRRGGCATSKSKLRGRHYTHETATMPPTSHAHRIMPHPHPHPQVHPHANPHAHAHAMRRSTFPAMYHQPAYVYDDLMVPRVQRSQQQMPIKQEQNYIPMTPTPEATAPNPFSLMVPEPSLMPSQAIASSSASNNHHGTAGYSLSGAGAGQGSVYVGPSSTGGFPLGMADVTGVYQPAGGHHDDVGGGGGFNERLLGMGPNLVYNWHNNGI